VQHEPAALSELSLALIFMRLICSSWRRLEYGGLQTCLCLDFHCLAAIVQL